MPTIAVNLTDAQMLMAEWDAKRRGITVTELFEAAVRVLTDELQSRHAQTHASEAASLFARLAPSDQQRLLQLIKNSVV